MDTDPTTNLIYTESQCGGGNDPVQVLNGANNTLVAGPLGTGGVSNTDVKVNSTTGKVYAAAGANGSSWTRVFGPSPNFSFLYDLSNLTIAAVNPVTNRLYFNDSSGNFEVFDGSNDTHLTTVTGVTGQAAANTSLNRIYVMDQTSQLIETIDGGSNTVVGTFSLGTNITPVWVAVDSSKNLLYVVARMPDNTTDLYILQDSAAPATHFRVAAPASTVAGTSFNITITALDASGHTATGYTGTVHFTSTDKKAALPADYTFTAADAGVHTFKFALVTAGSQTITATDTVTSTITGKSSAIKVSAAAVDHLKIKAPASSTAGVAFSITITAQDAFNNTVTNYTGTVHFTSTDGQAAVPGDYTFTTTNKGVHSFSVTLKTAGNQSITATDTVTASVKGSASIAVKPGKASTLSISAPASVTQGVAFTFSVIALDAYGNVATGYTGTVHFSSSDAAASLPANFTFLSADAGVEAFTAILNTTGSQSLMATDTATSSITGTDSSIQVNAGAAAVRQASTSLVSPLSATDLADRIARLLEKGASTDFWAA